MVTALSFYLTVFVREVLMLTRQEREQAVLDLYNQGKTIREIAKELRMSFRDIGTVLKKEEKEKERPKRQLDNDYLHTVMLLRVVCPYLLKPTNCFPKVKLP
jgi:hypothetical protein